MLGQAPSGDSAEAARELGARDRADAHLEGARATRGRRRAVFSAGRRRTRGALGQAGPFAQGVMGRNAPLLQRSRALSSLANELLPTEHRILLVSQNSAELRPTGGFIGSYGILTIGPEGVKLDSYKDVYTLPNPPGRVPMPPGALMTKRMDFQFRDANWWIDFPTSARKMLGFWADMGQPPVDGIIAVDVVAMQDILERARPDQGARTSRRRSRPTTSSSGSPTSSRSSRGGGVGQEGRAGRARRRTREASARRRGARCYEAAARGGQGRRCQARADVLRRP